MSMTLLDSHMFQAALGSLIALSICMAVGFLSRKIGLINDQISAGMSNILMKVTLPCTVFVSMQRPFSRELLAESGITLVITMAIFSTGLLIGSLSARLLKADSDEKSIWQFALVFANVGYMGFPVTQAVYGDACLIYTSVANISFNLLAFTVGIALFSKEKNNPAEKCKKILLNPAIIATVIGFIFFICSLSTPEPVFNGISMMGNMTSPLSMIIVGGILAKSDIRKVFLGYKMYFVIFIRLLVIPLISLLIIKPFIQNDLMLGVIILLLSMPVASLTAIYAEQYGGNSMLASKIVFVSTVLCIITIPLVSLLL